jgi:hypothetical protein
MRSAYPSCRCCAGRPDLCNKAEGMPASAGFLPISLFNQWSIIMSGKIQIVFNPDWEIMFDYNGITDVLSGTSPYCPGQTRLVLRNCTTRVTKSNKSHRSGLYLF